VQEEDERNLTQVVVVCQGTGFLPVRFSAWAANRNQASADSNMRRCRWILFMHAWCYNLVNNSKRNVPEDLCLVLW